MGFQVSYPAGLAIDNYESHGSGNCANFVIVLGCWIILVNVKLESSQTKANVVVGDAR